MEKDIQLQGLNFHYKESGEGHPIVLMHGWGCDIHIFAQLEAFLNQHFKVYNIDFPGFGKSQEPPVVWGTAEYEMHFKEFLKALHIENPILIGHSFGGRIAIRVAKDTPIPKMVLMGSAGIKPTRSIEYYFKVYSFKLLKFFAQLPVIYTLFGKEMIESRRKKAGSADYQKASDIMRGTLSKVVNEDLRHFMPKIKASTLLIFGENDTATPVADARIMEKMIPDAGLVVMKNAGHYVFLDQRDQVHAIINNFLAKE
ncbi:MAG: alpha/beta fold hydrolase, partial [Saprospiraceae bacterium]